MTTPRLRYPVNLLDDGSVVTNEGEFLGTWGKEEFDALFQFLPDGATEPLLMDPYFGLLCKKIDAWHSGIPYPGTPL